VATPTIVVLVLVVLGTIATLTWLVVLLARRVGAVAGDVQELQRRLGPTLERLRQEAEVTQRELDRVGRDLDDVQAHHHDRHGHRHGHALDHAPPPRAAHEGPARLDGQHAGRRGRPPTRQEPS
jgi:hypothetical protein